MLVAAVPIISASFELLVEHATAVGSYERG